MSHEETRSVAPALPGPRADGRQPLLVHVHISKTGGSTLNHILRSSYGPRHCPVEPWDSRWGEAPFTARDLRRLRKLYPDLRSIAGHRVVGYVDLELPDMAPVYCAFMRDPVKACASRFQHRATRSGKPEEDFDEWIEKAWTQNRHTQALSGGNDLEAAIRLIREKQIFIGLADRFDESLVLLKRLVAPDLDICYRNVNVARDRGVSDRLLSDANKRLRIIESQQVDLALHEFVRDELYPTYREAYGPTLDEDVARQREINRGFNRWNILASRLKAHSAYKPALYLHRRRTHRAAQTP